MPIYTYNCPHCGRSEDVLLSTSEARNADKYSVECDHPHHRGSARIAPQRMVRVMSLTAQHVMGGSEGKARNAEHLQKRNADYWSSKQGKERHQADVQSAYKRLGMTK